LKTIRLTDIRDKIKDLVQEANFELQDDVLAVIKDMAAKEEAPAGQEVFKQMLENADIAREERLGLCQDTGLAVFAVELGEDVRFEKTDGLDSLRDAIYEGTRLGYAEGYLRKSVVEDPVRRKNTGTNTPAYIHWDLVPGDAFKVSFIAKGGGAENMSAIGMLKPSQGRQGAIDFIVDTVGKAGPNPCPPILVGVGLGGTFEKAAYMAKHSLLREVGSTNPDPRLAELEDEIERRCNALGIGPAGLGGITTVIDVFVEELPAHIASMPVAVNVQCHSARHKEVVL